MTSTDLSLYELENGVICLDQYDYTIMIISFIGAGAFMACVVIFGMWYLLDWLSGKQEK